MADSGDSSLDVTVTDGKELVKIPEVVAAVEKDPGLSPADYIRSLPTVVRRRIKALKKLQAEANRVESRFFEEVHALECKYAAKYEPFLQKRRDIVTAVHEPTDSECDWVSDEEEEESLAQSLESKAKIESGDVKPSSHETKMGTPASDGTEMGIPDFWLTVFHNTDLLSPLIQERDEPILKHLRDVQLHLDPAKGFTLEFVFGPNDYFTNSSLTKEYIYRFAVDEDFPLLYEGPEIVKAVGCAIDWKKGQNVTVKLIKKVQKHKKEGTTRTVTKTVPTDSFFNFFSPPEAPADGEEADEETQELLARDFDIGHFLRESVLPRAVLYFTGEALELDGDDDEDDEGEGCEEYEEEEEDNEDCDH